MNLYRLSQTERRGYDTYDSCVVAAPDEESARKIHPSEFAEVQWWRAWFPRGWASKPENVEVEWVGVAKPGTEAGVICASFNAG